MSTSAHTDPGPFASEAWTHSIVLREAHRIWFGFGWQRNGGWLLLLLAVGFALGGIGVLVEPVGLDARDAAAVRWIIGTGVFAAALALALVGIRFLRGTNRVGVLDLQLGFFSAVDPKTGKVGEAISCRQLHVHLEEIEPVDADEDFHGRISIVGPDLLDRGDALPQIDTTILHCRDVAGFFTAIRELQAAAPWKGIAGDEELIKMYRDRL